MLYLGHTLEVFGQSQRTRSAGQSEHPELFRRRGFVEISAFQTDWEESCNNSM